MKEEAAFLDEIKARPGDDTARLVYADWLDDHGQPARAAFLRAECAAAAGTPMPARTCRRYSKGLPQDWLRAVGRPPMAGTVWVAVDDHGPARIAFRGDGTLLFHRFEHGADPEAPPSRRDPRGVPGTWVQVGTVVLFNVNEYSDHFGRLDGPWRMAVRWTNRTKDRGAWVFRRTEQPPPRGRGRRQRGG